MHYYNILLITTKDIYLDNSSSSYTIRSFLQNWPKENVRQIVCAGFNEIHRGRVSENTYYLNSKDVCIGSFFVKHQRTATTSLGMTSTNVTYSSGSIKLRIKQCLKALYAILPYRRLSQLNTFIQDFKPDILYSAFMDFKSLDLTLYVANKFGLPVLPHIMDDWLNTYLNQSEALYFFRKIFKYKVNNLFACSRIVLCISDKMCEEYRKRYNIPIAVSLMHSVNPIAKDVETCSLPLRKTLLYCGSLYLGRDKVVKMIGEILDSLQEDIQLKLFIPIDQWNELKSHFTSLHSIVYGGFITQEELHQEILGSHGLILAESFDESMLSYTGLSMSTKVPEYLSSGIPILAIGHKDQGSIEYLANNQAAYIVNNVDNLPEMLNKLLQGDNIDNILKNAQRLFLDNHAQSKQCDKFYNVVRDSVNNEK